MRISDWSSDVCSSDLTTGGLIMGRPSGDSGDLAAPKGSREETEEEEAYDRLVDEGHERLSRPLLPLLATGLLGGIDVGVGVLSYLVVLAETDNHLLASLAFSIGFVALLIDRKGTRLNSSH